MFWLQVVVAIGIVLATVLVAGGRGDGLAPADVDRRRSRLPADRPLAPADLDTVTLGVGFRGYRMEEVDELIDRVGLELAERDERIAELERRAGRSAPAGDMRSPRAPRAGDAGGIDVTGHRDDGPADAGPTDAGRTGAVGREDA